MWKVSACSLRSLVVIVSWADPVPGGGGTHVYLQHVYVRPSRGPFHASPAVPKDIFFTNQPVQMPFYPFLRYTVEKNLKFSGFIARS